MKLEIRPLPKAPRRVAQVGDIFTYTHPEENYTIRGLIIRASPNEYRMLNLETMHCGGVFKISADDLFIHYRDRMLKDFKYYPNSSWQAKLILEEIK